jgi:uncharacterized membrane protein
VSEIKIQATIDRPVTDVFRLVVDFRRAPEWQTHVLTSGVTAGDPVRLGTSVSQSWRWMGGDAFMNADVVEYEINKRVRLSGVFIRFPFTRDIWFSSTGGRQTAIIDTVTFRTGWLYFWYAPILGARMRRVMGATWTDLQAWFAANPR